MESLVSPRTRTIESRHNSKFKEWKQCISFPERNRCSWLPFEGWKTVTELDSAGRSLELLLISDTQIDRARGLMKKARQVYTLPQRLFRLLSSHPSPQGVIGCFEKPKWNWSDLTPFVLALHRLQDPGNLGTLIRTAAATGVFSLVTSPGTVSCFNSKVIKASSGALYSVPFLEGVSISDLHSAGYRIWAALANDGTSLFDAELEPPLAIVVGSEGRGLDSLDSATHMKTVHIPMRPSQESLNAAVAGSLLMYEVFRRTLVHRVS